MSAMREVLWVARFTAADYLDEFVLVPSPRAPFTVGHLRALIAAGEAALATGSAAGVGEVTAEDVLAAFNAVEKSTETFPGETWKQGRADIINARIRARAGSSDTIPVRVVKQPTRPVSSLVVPEFGYYFARIADDEWSVNALPYSEGFSFADGVTAIREWDRNTGEVGPIVERTTTPEPRAWEASDITITGWMLPYRNGEPVDWSGPYHSEVMDKAVSGANECGADMLVSLPTILPGGTP